MMKSELVKKLADKTPHLYIQDVDRIVNIVLDRITNTLLWMPLRLQGKSELLDM